MERYSNPLHNQLLRYIEELSALYRSASHILTHHKASASKQTSVTLTVVKGRDPEQSEHRSQKVLEVTVRSKALTRSQLAANAAEQVYASTRVYKEYEQHEGE